MMDRFLDLPPMPSEYCLEAGLVRVFVEDAAEQLNSLVEQESKQSDATVISLSNHEAVRRRIKMAADYLVDYTVECTGCSGDQIPETCPLQPQLDFIREVML